MKMISYDKIHMGEGFFYMKIGQREKIVNHFRRGDLNTPSPMKILPMELSTKDDLRDILTFL